MGRRAAEHECVDCRSIFPRTAMHRWAATRPAAEHHPRTFTFTGSLESERASQACGDTVLVCERCHRKRWLWITVMSTLALAAIAFLIAWATAPLP